MTFKPFHPDLPDLTERELVDWLHADRGSGRSRIAAGSQAAVHLFDNGRYRLIIKRPKGLFFWWLRLMFLRREYGIYQRLQDVHGVPRCYGLLRGRYLVLEYVDAPDLRHATLADKPAFLVKLLQAIQAMHTREIAHGDLKRKDNILVLDGREPYLIDFGVAARHKQGFHPVNRFVYGTLKQMDLNAWLKHKYGPGFQGMSEQDRVHYQATAIERIFDVLDRPYHSIKRAWRRLKARLA